MIHTWGFAVTGFFFKVGYYMSTDKNTAENYLQGKNQFTRFRILQTEVGEHAIIMCMSFILLGNADVSN